MISRMRMATLPWQSCRMSHRGAHVFAALTAAGLTTVAMARGLPPCGYDAEIFLPPNCGPFKVFGTAAAVNEAGVAVGWIDGCPNPWAYRGFIWWPDGAIQIITVPGAFATQAVGINSSKQVLLRLEISGEGHVPAVWEAGTVTVCGKPEWANQSETGGINDLGVVTGQYGDVVVGPYPLAATWEGGQLTDISAKFPQPNQQPSGINNAGQIVGTMSGAPVPDSGYAWRAFVYQDGAVVDLGEAPGCVNSHALDVSQAGHIAAYGWTSIWAKGVSDSHPWLGYVWREGVWTKLDPLPGHDESQPTAVNSSGDAVGYSVATGGGTGRVIWVDGEPHKLALLLQPGLPGVPSQVMDLSDAGVIVGDGLKNGANRPARLVPRARLTADLNEDCAVNGIDLAAILQNWGPQRKGTFADIDEDGEVDGVDLGLLLEQWTG